MVVGVSEQLRQFAKGTADAIPHCVLVLVGERFKKLKYFHRGSLTGLNKGKYIVNQTQTVKGWQSLLANSRHQLLEKIRCVARPVEANVTWINLHRNKTVGIILRTAKIIKH